jgi:hypothetical protein
LIFKVEGKNKKPNSKRQAGTAADSGVQPKFSTSCPNNAKPFVVRSF